MRFVSRWGVYISLSPCDLLHQNKYGNTFHIYLKVSMKTHCKKKSLFHTSKNIKSGFFKTHEGEHEPLWKIWLQKVLWHCLQVWTSKSTTLTMNHTYTNTNTLAGIRTRLFTLSRWELLSQKRVISFESLTVSPTTLLFQQFIILLSKRWSTIQFYHHNCSVP